MITKAEQKRLKAVDFMESLEFEIDVTWRDKSGTHKLDDNRHVSIVLATSGTHDKYPGVKVTVYHNQNGALGSHYFRFDDFLDKDKRIDQRPDYPGGDRRTLHFQVIGHCGWYWYIATPKTSRPFCEVVEGWIEEWR